MTWTIFGSSAATFVFQGGTTLTAWHFVEQTFANVLFSAPCVALCIFALPVVVPLYHRTFPIPINWIFLVATLVAFGLAGSFIGGLAGIAIGLIPPGQPFMTWYAAAARVAVYFTVIFGLSGTFVHELRSRLAKTTVALRTKERDEAEARRLAAEAQLASLEARVDPHFLFNTLNSIAALVRDRPADAERVIEQLSSLMRSSLDRRASPLVPIEDELATVASYLEIERVRFGERLRFQIDSAVTSAALVPRLALQTLTENSVKYAVSTSRDGATVAIRAATLDGRLHVSVEDDGPGFDGSCLPEGHGLQLLKARLAMIYADRAQLGIASRAGRTVVTLDMPLKTTPPPQESTETPTNESQRDSPCL